MGLIRNRDDKRFTKRSTPIDVPAVSRSQIVTTGITLTDHADIDLQNPATLYFHIFNQIPAQMKLYVWGERFHQAYYTELGIHNHTSGSFITGNVTSGTTLHNHPVSGTSPSHGHNISTSSDTHRHFLRLEFDVNDTSYHLDVDGGSGYYSDGNPIMGTYVHSHSGTTSTQGGFAFGSYLSVNNTSVNTHGHSVSGTSALTGITPGAGSVRTSGMAKSYFNGMKISIDGVDQTTALLAQVALAAFGDGTSGHVIVTTGVLLDLAPFIFTPGQHKIVFSQTGVNNGGKVRYNLYLL